MTHRPVVRAVLVGLFVACGGDAVAPPEPVPDPTQLYWQLTLNHHAVNLTTDGPSSSFQLVATPLTVEGVPLPGGEATRFRSLDPDRVLVDGAGRVRGVQEVAEAPVVAELTQGDLTHTDTAFISVTASVPPAPAQFSLEPDPADSAKVAWPTTDLAQFYFPPPQLIVRVLDANGLPIDNVLVRESSHSTIADPLTVVSNSAAGLTLHRPGAVTFHASAVAYGLELADTLEYTVGQPLMAFIQPQTRAVSGGTGAIHQFAPSTYTIGAGGYAMWFHNQEDPLYDVTFDAPANVEADSLNPLGFACGGAGDIPTFGDATGDLFTNICVRRFPVAGTYTYRSAALNSSGTLVVVDEAQSLFEPHASGSP